MPSSIARAGCVAQLLHFHFTVLLGSLARGLRRAAARPPHAAGGRARPGRTDTASAFTPQRPIQPGSPTYSVPSTPRPSPSSVFANCASPPPTRVRENARQSSRTRRRVGHHQFAKTHLRRPPPVRGNSPLAEPPFSRTAHHADPSGSAPPRPRIQFSRTTRLTMHRQFAKTPPWSGHNSRELPRSGSHRQFVPPRPRPRFWRTPPWRRDAIS